MNDLLAELGAPFPRDKIHWRVGATNAKKLGVKPWEATKGVPLAYINARDVMERLDEVVGPENWQSRFHGTDKRVICELSIRVDGEWVTKSDGAGATDVEGDKGAISDALKRAAVSWNIGRYLYNCENRWVDLENGKLPKKFGQAEILKAAESAFSSPRLRKKYIDSFRECIAENNHHRLNEEWLELNTDQIQELWRQFASNERSAITAMRKEAA